MTTALLAFNRGLVSRLGLARVDVKRIAMAAAQCWNFIPRVLGSMSIRPGWKYLGGMRGNAPAKLIPFVFSILDTHILELTASNLRVWWNDALVEREAVGSGITNGTFSADLSGWTDSDEAGAASTWATGGYAQLLGDGTNAAILDQEITVAGGDVGVEHALNITIQRGPVHILVGSTLGGEDYVADIALGTGHHSLAFSPSGNFFVRLLSRESYPVLVTSITVASSGTLTVTAPWAAADLGNVRWDQSGDIVFVACAGHQQRMIQRWDIHSWSIVRFEPIDGPFRIENTTKKTLTPSALTGEITITASAAVFKTGHVGALFSMTSEGQTVTANISAENTFTDPIRITGVDASRVFTIILSGTWSATVTLQRSLEEEDPISWEDITTINWTANTTETFDDGLDNQIAWYRIGVKTSDYTSGTVAATLTYALGFIRGVVRITAYTSSLSVTAVVLSDLGGTAATEVWAEGEWSDYRGWPTAVAFHDGRLVWAGKNKVWASVTDAFDSHDPDYVGDAGPLSRTLGAGPVDNINWLMSSYRLLLGADMAEYSGESNSLDEPITPSAFSVRLVGGQGSAAVQPDKVDTAGLFVNRTGMKLFEISYGGANNLKYGTRDLCQLVPAIGDPGMVRMAIQRNPDTRVHCVRSDGTVAMLVFDAVEDVLCWVEIDTDGEVEDAVVLPAQSGVTDDYVYYVVKRTIDGATVRYLEKWAQSANTVGGLGIGTSATPLKTFSSFESVISDGATFDWFYNESNEKLYVAGTFTDDVYIHDDNAFISSPVTVDASGEIHAQLGSGILSREGRYFWLSGRQATPVDTIRVLDTTTNTLTDMGNVGSNEENLVLAATESPTTKVMVWENNGPTQVRMYAPNIATGSMGSPLWTITKNIPGSSSIAWVGTWDDDNNVWFNGRESSTHMLWQVDSATGAYAQHSVPAGKFGGEANLAFDSAHQRLFVVYGDISSNGYLYEYSGWAETPTADSGTWTLLFSYAPPGNDYGRWISYDEVSGTLMMGYREDPIGSISYVLRYTGFPLVLVDTVNVSATDSGADVYPFLLESYQIYYRNGYAYFAANNGGTTHYLLKLLYQGDEILFDTEGNSLQLGGSVGRLHDLADSYINYSGTPITMVTGLDHLEGEEVVVWGNGVDLGTTSTYGQTYTVSGGQITLAAEATNLTVGLVYTARFVSSKLALQTESEVLFGKERRITGIALVLADTHAKGIRFGPDLDNLDDRPERDNWVDVDADNIDTAYDQDMIQFPTTWATDLRVALKAQAPRPCTVLAVKLEIEV